jgi:hypothetical protein
MGERQTFLQRGTPSAEACSVYFVVGDADELHDFHRSTGVEVTVGPGDRPYHLRDYTVRDADGYSLTFRSGSRSDSPRCSRISRSTSA